MDTPVDTLPDTASPSVRFFYENAGYQVGRRLEGAEELARAEEWACSLGENASYLWTPADMPWDGDEPLPEGCAHEDCLFTVFQTCPCCGVTREVARESLSSIAYMPGDGFPRVVRAELALQAHTELERKGLL